MPDQMDAVRTTRIDQRADIVHQLRHPIIPATTRPCAARVAPLLWRQTPIARLGEARNHSLPRHIGLRVTMQEHDYLGVGPATIADIEGQVLASKLLHRAIIWHHSAKQGRQGRDLRQC